MIFPLLFAIIASFALSACSLNYGNEDENDTDYPEFAFYSASLVRYENARQTVAMSAIEIEKYRGSDASYAKNASFTTWNNQGEKENEGACTLLKADSNKKQYVLLDGITLKNSDFEIEATSLFWDGNTEQMLSGKDEIVVLKRDDVKMEGRGFSANAINKSFSFSGMVDGVITTSSENKSEIEAKNEN